MATTRIFTRSLFTAKQTLTSLLTRSYTSAVVPLSPPPPPPPPSSLSPSLSLLLLLLRRPLSPPRSLLTTKQTLTSLLTRSYTSAVVPLSPPPPPSSLSPSLSLLLLLRRPLSPPRSLLTTKQTLTSLLTGSYTSAVVPLSPPPRASSLSPSLPLLHRPLVAANFHRLSPATTTVRGYCTREPAEVFGPGFVKDDGCDFKHWLVVMKKPVGDPIRDDIIDSYIKTLAKVVGSEEEARMKIYSVSTRHYFAFGALVAENLATAIKELPNVRYVLPDLYLNVETKDYGGEPFIDGQAVPYDPKYHEEWVRNNAMASNKTMRHTAAPISQYGPNNGGIPYQNREMPESGQNRE